MKIVSVILARGGSKEIPLKNITLLNKKPLIYYTINASKMSKVSETWVATDNLKIENISKVYGAKIFHRQPLDATDTASCELALLNFTKSTNFDILVFIQPTAPLLKYYDINKGIDTLIDNNLESVFSAYEGKWRAKWTKDLNSLDWDETKRPRRQDCPEHYIENGAFYIIRRDALLKYKNRHAKNKGVVIMPLKRSFEIDTLEDINLVELIMKGE